jgi:SAM-dependent methyltransferase
VILLKICDRLLRKLLGTFYFLNGILNYKAQNNSNRFKLKLRNLYPCISDRTTTTDFDRHYVYHTAWAVRKVIKARPEKHIDISSSLFFCSTLSSVIPTEFYDYRPADLKLSNLSTHFSDLCQLPFATNSISSLSCMHVVEHVGLGRYGDQINPEGDLKAFEELKRVVAPGGRLLLVIPIGTERIQFNAHRIYSSRSIKNIFSDWVLEELYLIPDKSYSNIPILNPGNDVCDLQIYGCGCFLYEKRT